jgi:hypothetical protein
MYNTSGCFNTPTALSLLLLLLLLLAPAAFWPVPHPFTLPPPNHHPLGGL